MKILVTGVKGQLGYDCVEELHMRGIEAIGVDREDFDLTDEAAVMAYVKACKPDGIMHCAAYTAVDRAETDPTGASLVNGQGTLNIVRAALEVGAKLMYISTDYVFSGEGDQPFEVNDPYGAKNIYGLTKAQGEQAVRNLMQKYFIIRTSWVYGLNGANFVRTMLRLGSEKTELKVVGDQIGSPTYTTDLSRLMADMIVTDRYGIYHGTNEGYCSWAEFAQEIMKLWHLNCRIVPVTTEEYGSATQRPKNSRLSKASLDEARFHRLPAWQDALMRYMMELRRNGIFH